MRHLFCLIEIMKQQLSFDNIHINIFICNIYFKYAFMYNHVFCHILLFYFSLYVFIHLDEFLKNFYFFFTKNGFSHLFYLSMWWWPYYFSFQKHTMNTINFINDFLILNHFGVFSYSKGIILLMKIHMLLVVLLILIFFINI